MLTLVDDVTRWWHRYTINGELELQLTYQHPETETAWRWLAKMDDNRFGT